MKNQKSKKHIRFSLKTSALTTIIILIVVAVLTEGWFINFLWRQNTDLANAKIGTMVVHAIEGVNRPLPIDAKSGKSYIKDANLTLPPAPSGIENNQYVYAYSPPFQNMNWELNLAYLPSIQEAESPLLAGQAPVETYFSHDVAKLQACARGVHISPTPSANDVATKKLADGRVVYFTTEKLCPVNNLLDFAKQIDSY